jgi:hypothetical protein
MIKGLFEYNYNPLFQWKRINHIQSARWLQLSRLKASAFLFEDFLLVFLEIQQLILDIGNAI